MSVADPYEQNPVVITGEPSTTAYGTTSAGGRAEEAKAQASNVKDSAAQAAGSVAETAKDQAGTVLSEAGDQAKQLAGQAKSELSSQASSAQGKLADTVRSLAQELSSMASHDADRGMATDLVREGADRADALASWLQDREPKAILDDVSAYARQHPGTFLALAAGAGIVAGRLIRGLRDDSAADAPTTATGTEPTERSAVGYSAPSYAGSELEPVVVTPYPA